MLPATECVPNVTEISTCREYKELKVISQSCFSPELPRGHNRKRWIPVTLHGRNLPPPSTKREVAMLAKCVNQACFATLHYFHEGKLFAIESRIHSPRRGLPVDPEYTGSPHGPQYFWLCSSCCRAMTVQSDGDRGVTIVPMRRAPQDVSIIDHRMEMVA